jgi:hypothetical protein
VTNRAYVQTALAFAKAFAVFASLNRHFTNPWPVADATLLFGDDAKSGDKKAPSGGRTA